MAWIRWPRAGRTWSCIRWMQEIRPFKPSTVSGRFSVTARFNRTRVIDGLLEHSPAEHVRRPTVSAESPTLGFTHLQFEALLTAAWEAANPCDFALMVMLGLLVQPPGRAGLRVLRTAARGVGHAAGMTSASGAAWCRCCRPCWCARAELHIR